MKFQSQTLLFASAALPAAFAQTWTACNPLEKSCPCDDALGTTYTFDFTKGKASDVFPADPNFKVEYKSDGVHLPVTKKGDAPTLLGNKYILGGKLDVVLKIAPGKGIVSSLVFQSDDLDEIDYEWIGSKGSEVQTNYFGKGNTEQYNRGGTSPVTSADGQFHKYTIEWTQTAITWSLDGNPIRTLTPADSAKLYNSNNYYPQTPMQIKIGPWAAGDPSNSPGVVTWSDGPIDYSAGPYEMVVQSLTLQDYTQGATQYCYGDKTGTWGSINVSKDKVSPASSSAAAAPASTSAPSAGSSAAASSVTASSVASGARGGSQTTLSTSTGTASAAKSSESVNTSTMEVAPAVTQGMPNSIGGYTPAPENKGVASTTTSGTSIATATSAPQSTNSQGAASSVRNVGLGGVVVAAMAAVLAL